MTDQNAAVSEEEGQINLHLTWGQFGSLKGKSHQVPIDYPSGHDARMEQEHIAAQFLGQNARSYWARILTLEADDSYKVCYSFADVRDAIHFKLRFG